MFLEALCAAAIPLAIVSVSALFYLDQDVPPPKKGEDDGEPEEEVFHDW